MKNVTIALDDEVHRQARIYAAREGTSLSALVKSYLEGLVAVDSAMVTGVRDMQMPFAAQPATFAKSFAGLTGPEGQPYCVNGTWVWTKDGKPRKPGALRHLPPLPDDSGEWPDDILASFEAWPYDDPDYAPAGFDWPDVPSE